jgi:hypothetical protein
MVDGAGNSKKMRRRVPELREAGRQVAEDAFGQRLATLRVRASLILGRASLRRYSVEGRASLHALDRAYD